MPNIRYPKTRNSSLETNLRGLVRDATSFIEEELSPERTIAQDYYNGEVSFSAPEGTSDYVSTRVRDSVDILVANLMGVFKSTDRPIIFCPTEPGDVELASQATTYVNVVFERNKGYSVLRTAIQDALLKKTGVVRVVWEEEEIVDSRVLENLTQEEYNSLEDNDDIDEYSLINQEVVEFVDPDTQASSVQNSYTVEVLSRRMEGRVKYQPILPENFIINREARTLEDATVLGWQEVVRIGDLIDMGYDEERIKQVMDDDKGSTSTHIQDSEDDSRRGYNQSHDSEHPIDPMSKKVRIYEVFVEVRDLKDEYQDEEDYEDEDTEGFCLYKFTLVGTSLQLLAYEKWEFDSVPLAVFTCYPEPHTFFGKSVADRTIFDQDIITATWRNFLNNLALANTPKTVVNQDVNLNDVVNSSLSHPIRTKGSVDNVKYLQVNSIAAEALTGIEQLTQEMDAKLGLSKASTGLSPDALQAVTATAVIATQSAQGTNGT